MDLSFLLGLLPFAMLLGTTSEAEVTEENAEEIALAEFKREKAEKLGKKPEEIPDPYEKTVAIHLDDKTPEELEAEKRAEEERKAEEERLLSANDDDLSDEEKEKKKALLENAGKKEEDAGKKEEIADEELLKIDDKDLDEKQLERKKVLLELEAEQVREREDLLLEKPEEELTDEEKVQVQEIKERREKEEKEAFENRVKEYAEANKVSEEEARKDLESIYKIRDKYAGDPIELSKANLNLQRLNSQKDAKIKELEQARAIPKDIDWVKVINEGALTLGGKKFSRDEAIALYREDNPDVTDPLDDDAVVKLLAKDVKIHYEQGLAKEQELMKEESKKKLATMIDSLSEADKKWLPEFKPVLDTYSPREIMSDKFDINELVCWAKGKAYDKDIQALRKEIDETKKRYLELGRASSRIKAPIGSGSSPDRSGKSVSLTPEQEAEAWDMFPNAKDDKECFELYTEVLEHKKALASKHKKE